MTLHRSLRAVLVAAVVAVPATHRIAARSAQDAASAPSRTVADAVYTKPQAARGQSMYTEACASCHLQDLSGSNQAPSLAGPDFIDRWDGQNVGELVERIRTSMPADNIGSLTRESSTDLVAFLLQANDFPAGQADLAPDRNVLKTIVIRKK